MARVIVDPGDLADHLGDARQGPQLVVVAPSPRPFDQRLLDRLALSVGHPGLAPGPTGAIEALLARACPGSLPTQRRHSADVKTTRHLRLRRTVREHLRRTKPASPELLKVTTCHPSPSREEDNGSLLYCASLSSRDARVP